jgi:hypothetical protein
MTTEYILIDFENVQPRNVGRLKGGAFALKVFVGNQQVKGRISYELAEAMHALGSSAEFVRIEGSGRNALDFHIAYYLGRLAQQSPNSRFHVISKDTDYDVLIRHLNAHGVRCQRWRSVDEIPNPPTTRPKALPDKGPADALAAIVMHLRNLKASRPRKLRSLASTLKTRFGKDWSDADVQDCIAALQRRGVLRVSGTGIAYDLDKMPR